MSYNNEIKLLERKLDVLKNITNKTEKEKEEVFNIIEQLRKLRKLEYDEKQYLDMGDH